MSQISLNDDHMYTLTDGSAWFDVKKFAIRIHSTDEGVVVDIFSAAALEENAFCDALASTYAFDEECEKEEQP